MKELDKAIRGIRTLVFLDLEGTQFTHEMIEIGGYKVKLREDCTVKKVFPPFKAYVKAKNRVGPRVTELTGITDAKLRAEGIPFRVAQQNLRKYVGRDWDRCRFVFFGNHDNVILTSSGENNMDASMEDVRFINHHSFDFQAFISRYVKDPNGNPYSLTNYLKVFGLPFDGQAHDALADALNLIDLYAAFLAHPEVVKEEYKKVLARGRSLPTPVAICMRKLLNGETVSPEDYDKAIQESLL